MKILIIALSKKWAKASDVHLASTQRRYLHRRALADIARRHWHVRLVPNSDIGRRIKSPCRRG
jgi:hypothetical protein